MGGLEDHTSKEMDDHIGKEVNHIGKEVVHMD